MRIVNSLIISIIIAALFPAILFCQVDEEDEFDRLLRDEVEVEDPVYKPVVAFGIGSFGYMGDVTDFYGGLWSSQPG